MKIMKEGDLIYIPQDVRLFDRKNIYIGKTEKPIIGVLIEEIPIGAPFQAGTYVVYAQGREATVARKYAYPIRGQYAS